MIAGRNTDQSFSICLRIVRLISSNEFFGRSFRILAEIRMIATEQIIIMRWSEVKQKVHVKTADQRLIRLTPF